MNAIHSVQLQGRRNAVHCVGLTDDGVLYVDIQRFDKDGSDDATTYYVGSAYVEHVKRKVAPASQGQLSDHDLLRLFQASFPTAEYALDWLHWAGIPTVRRHDAHAQYNAEAHIPCEVKSLAPEAQLVKAS